MSLRALVALAMLGAPVAGCASVVPQVPSAVGHVPRTIDGPANPPPRGVAATGVTELCGLESLRWGHEFVPRATGRTCVTILGTVTLADE